MERFGVVINIRKLYRYFILLIAGLALITYGVMSFVIDQTRYKYQLSDEEIIQRAKALGMVEIKENIGELND